MGAKVAKGSPQGSYMSYESCTCFPGLTCCCCCCSHIISHKQVRGHRTGSSHSGAEEYPRENTHNPRWYTHISQLTQFMPPPVTYKGEIGSQSTMCQVQAGAYVSLLMPGETKYSDCRPSKIITRSIYHYAYARQA